MDAKSLLAQGDTLFSKRGSLMSLWQEIGDNFYPERANFTYRHDLGEDFGAHLQTSYPVLARRTLGNAFAGMLRRDDWFHIRAEEEAREDKAALEWLEFATQTQFRAMNDPIAQFARATKEGDHDFAAFGQAIISVELNRDANAFLYRNWHLRDVAWAEEYDGRIGPVHRKYKPFAADIVQDFPGAHPQVKKWAEKNPYHEFECRHIILPSNRVTDANTRLPYVSYYLDVENVHIMEKRGVFNKMYVIPRWQTVSGSQYAYSPATIGALPDARLIQAMTLTLLEAGEWAVAPPMLATKEAIRSDLALYSRGVTWVDNEYDERLGAAIRPITNDKTGMPFGMDSSDRITQLISNLFFLNDLRLPDVGHDMTAFEVRERMREWIRNALPIFEPAEQNYNDDLCETTFDLGRRAGLFGSMEDLPDSLKGSQIGFRFESPIREATERAKGQTFLEGKAMLLEAAELDQSVMGELDATAALRDVLSGIGVPAKWRPTEEEADALAAAAKEQAAMAQTLDTAGTAADVAKTAGEADIAALTAGVGGAR